MLRRELLIVALFAMLATGMTWPLAVNLDRAVAYPQDPYLNAWILDHVQHALTSPASLFDAPVLHPRREMLALSENMLGIAIPLLPLRLLGASPLMVLNVAMLLGFALSGYAMTIAARLAGASTGAAICGGIFIAFVPWRFTHLSHLQHMWTLWLPLMIAALLWYARSPSWRRASLFGVAFFLNGLTNLHWLAFGSVAIAVAALVCARRREQLRYWRGLTFATAIATIALIPILLPYAHVKKMYGFRTTAAVPLGYSAEPRDWLIPSMHNRLWGALNDGRVDPERWLFPGALVLLLAAIGLTRWKESRDGVGIALIWLLLGFFGSLGLRFPLHRLLFEHVPLFSGMRVPARWSMIAYCGLAILAALGVDALRRGRVRAFVAPLFALALLVELNAAPIRWYMAIAEPPAVSRWLASQKTRAIVELPMDPRFTYEYLLRATVHRQPLINGLTEPEMTAYWELVRLSEERSPRFLDELRRLECDLVIVHADLFGDRWESIRSWLAESLAARRLHYVGRFDAKLRGDYVFSLSPAPEPDVADRIALTRLLAGEEVASEGTFGHLDTPRWDERIDGKLLVTGWAFSPYGLREVRIRLGNGRWIVPANLAPYDAVTKLYPWYPMTTAPSFTASIERPRGMPALTDVQIEIVDGRGERKFLDDVWISWPAK